MVIVRMRAGEDDVCDALGVKVFKDRISFDPRFSNATYSGPTPIMNIGGTRLSIDDDTRGAVTLQSKKHDLLTAGTVPDE